MDGLQFKSRLILDILIFSKTSGEVLEPTQHAIHAAGLPWRQSGLDAKLSTHFYLVPRLRMGGGNGLC
jgi:hypothetical protein